jgi:hypothetical protein
MGDTVVYASEDTIEIGDILICMVDEYYHNNKQPVDGHVLRVDENGVDILYTSGYKSRNDYVVYADVVAKVDQSQPYVKNVCGVFHFLVFGAML